MSEVRCAVCSGKMIGVSRVNHVDLDSRFSWENESTLRLLGLQEADVQLRICTDCLHMVLHPVFDAACLYGEEGGKVRKEVRASYGTPSIVPGKGKGRLDFQRHFRSVSKDFKRFQRVTEYISRNLQGRFEGLDEIRILDWGGGDGYLSTVYAKALEATTLVPVRPYVFDYTEWAGNEGNVVGIKDLERMEPAHVLILSGILEHTHDPVGTLRLAASHLHEGGIVVCEVPDERYVLYAGLSGRKFGLHYHVCYYTERSLFRTLSLAGFENAHTRLDANSSYRGKPIRFFLGIGCKSASGDSHSPGGPSRLMGIVDMIAYGAERFARSVWRRGCRVCKKGSKVAS